MSTPETPPEADASVPGDAAAVDAAPVAADPVPSDPVVPDVSADAVTVDSATADPVVVDASAGPVVDENNVPQPFPPAQADPLPDDAVPVDVPVDLSNPTAPVVDTVSVSDPEPSPPISESATDPTADPIVPVVAEATPDTPPSLSEDAYAQNLAANLAGAPADSDIRTEAQLGGIETASAALLEAVRDLAVAGLTRGKIADSCSLAIEQLYVERRDAAVTGADDPYPSF